MAIASGFRRPGRKMTPEEVKEKVRENRLRRVLARRWAYSLVKSRRRDPQALDYGRYRIVDENNCLVAGNLYGRPSSMSLEDVEAWIEKGKFIEVSIGVEEVEVGPIEVLVKGKKKARVRRTK